MAMKKAIRCCISCILPCGALDVIRIVHANGKVEEICESHVKASEIMKLYPKHVLKKPSTCSSDDGICPKIVVVPPDAELQRGKIYFLMPLPPSSTSSDDSKSRSRSSSRKKKARSFSNNNSSSSQLLPQGNSSSNSNSNSNNSNLMGSDQYLSEILSEKTISTQRDRRRGRVGVWRPHLQSISESSTSDTTS